MQFKLGDISLKSPSAFVSGGKFHQLCSAHPITAFTDRLGKREYCDFIIYLASQGLVTFVIHLVAALFFIFFLRPLPQKAVSLNHSFTHTLQGAHCCFAHQTMSQQIFISGIWRWHWETDLF